ADTQVVDLSGPGLWVVVGWDAYNAPRAWARGSDRQATIDRCLTEARAYVAGKAGLDEDVVLHLAIAAPGTLDGKGLSRGRMEDLGLIVSAQTKPKGRRQ